MKSNDSDKVVAGNARVLFSGIGAIVLGLLAVAGGIFILVGGDGDLTQISSHGYPLWLLGPSGGLFGLIFIAYGVWATRKWVLAHRS